MVRILFLLFVLLSATREVTGQPSEARIQIIYMGGNDCPPCVAWRAIELPKLQATNAFKTVQFFLIMKTVHSPVPAAVFLPPEIRSLKEKLDVAGGGRGGSPQIAVIVNGEVYDYFFGTSRSALDFATMITAIQTGGRYPYKRCVMRNLNKGCAVPG